MGHKSQQNDYDLISREHVKIIREVIHKHKPLDFSFNASNEGSVMK